ncbi:hypothetical protein EYF80_054032 [Liparis tanakae]|uniref:Uncharacterized protein n=1 Tax=Liparis tanakae TaxID=230148 RepID=A0A4Z2F3S2_9TELE|nr:hypothetical protein EYF80_054032 [Liparis tanakae]
MGRKTVRVAGLEANSVTADTSRQASREEEEEEEKGRLAGMRKSRKPRRTDTPFLRDKTPTDVTQEKKKEEEEEEEEEDFVCLIAHFSKRDVQPGTKPGSLVNHSRVIRMKKIPPRKRKCSHSQVRISMMMAMGKLKMNHVPKLITLASG